MYFKAQVARSKWSIQSQMAKLLFLCGLLALKYLCAKIGSSYLRLMASYIKNVFFGNTIQQLSSPVIESHLFTIKRIFSDIFILMILRYILLVQRASFTLT